MTLEFGLQVSRFGFPDHPASTAAALADVARAAEEAGFTSIWVMDHFLQIPQIGREWEDMLESYTTLGYLAGVTERIRLGTLVTGISYRNIAHLGKILATLDVLSGGRAMCGLGAAWFEREHKLYGWDFPPLAERFDRLEDALELLPLLWGPGSPRFEGRTLTVSEAVCYPRPLQERIPIMVGGSGEKRTLRLVARHADACNLVGDVDRVRHKLAVLREHCAAEERDPAEIEVTHLAPARGGAGRRARGAGRRDGRRARGSLPRAGGGRGADGHRGTVRRRGRRVGAPVRRGDRGVPGAGWSARRLRAALREGRPARAKGPPDGGPFAIPAGWR